jgi:capsule polysaccharide export protein KpsE/RkpR
VPPQQSQGGAASALASLGALTGLAGVAGGLKSPADQYVSLMQSVTVQDRIIEAFDLMQVYKTKLGIEAREQLNERVRIVLGKKDGLISVEVDDRDPGRAAEIANRHVAELRRITAELALTEAQQRRVFFESQLDQARVRLAEAQRALQTSGFNQSTLRAEPRAAAEGYARLRAELTASEVRLRVLRSRLADEAPEMVQQQSLVAALRAQLTKLESSADAKPDSDYLSRYREFKYQETLFELFSKQFELARVDESRDGTLIQVVDAAVTPERKSKPRRSVIATVSTGLTGVALLVFVLLRHGLRRASADPLTSSKLQRLRASFRSGTPT